MALNPYSYSPYFRSVFANRSIGGEPADPRRIHRTRAPSRRAIPPTSRNLGLCHSVVLEVRRHQESVASHKSVDQGHEAVWLIVRENAGADSV
jgi:hypothetical protein